MAARGACCLARRSGTPPSVLCVLCCAVNPHLALQVMRRAQSNSPRIPPKKYHSFRETRDIKLDNLLRLPGYKPRRRRPPSYPAHDSPSRDHLHVPRIRVTCVPEAPQSALGRQNHSKSPGRMSGRSPGRTPGRSSGRSPDSRGRSPGRRVSRRMNRLFLLSLSSWICSLTH